METRARARTLHHAGGHWRYPRNVSRSRCAASIKIRSYTRPSYIPCHVTVHHFNYFLTRYNSTGAHAVAKDGAHLMRNRREEPTRDALYCGLRDMLLMGRGEMNMCIYLEKKKTATATINIILAIFNGLYKSKHHSKLKYKNISRNKSNLRKSVSLLWYIYILIIKSCFIYQMTQLYKRL